ncbi:MAG: hypothetical protein U0892_06595 [Pirellulales bacterium]
MLRIAVAVCLALGSPIGCGHFAATRRPPPTIEVPIANPFQVGMADPAFLWRQVVDEVDNYFRIAVESPVRRDEIAWIEGRLETFPEVGSTLLEPWRRDSTRGYERIQSTFKTIRRTCYAKVIPGPDGYMIDIQVIKEQEDVDHSQYPSAGSSTQRHDGSVVRTGNTLSDLPSTIGWYTIGRDLELERRIAEGIAGRLTNVETPRRNGLLDH